MIEIRRKTKETDIELVLNLYGSGKYVVSTGIGFFDHMLESFAKHSLIDLEIKCKGDVHVDFHHTVEDVGIVLGTALKKAIYPAEKIERFGDAVVAMDEAAVQAALDLSNRPYLVYDIDMDGKIGEFDTELLEEFFRAVVLNGSMTLHLVLERGRNRHHIAEAACKAYAVALRRALRPNEKISVPSTKGVL